MSNSVLYDQEEHIVILTLNKPEVRNAISDSDMINTLLDAFARINSDNSIGAVILTDRIAVNPTQAVRMTKRLLREAEHTRLEALLEMSAAMQALAHHTADHKEALAAFLEKRPPNLTGS